MVPHLRDETYRDFKTQGYNVRGIVRALNVGGHNVRGHIVPVPALGTPNCKTAIGGNC